MEEAIKRQQEEVAELKSDDNSACIVYTRVVGGDYEKWVCDEGVG